MKFRYRITTINPNGNIDTSSRDFEQESVTIGRGGNSDIVFQSTLVALEHVRFTIRDRRLVAEDLNSFSGIRINGMPTKNKKLSKNDELSVGEFTFTVIYEDSIWGIHEKRDLTQQASSKSQAISALPSLSVREALPPMGAIIAGIVILVLLPYLVWPMLSKNFLSWNSGPLSNKHNMIAGDCNRCHKDAFQTVQDQQCLSCHALTDHAPAMKEVLVSNPHAELRCAQCHFEHKGNERLHVASEQRCVSCHANLNTLNPKTENLIVKNFASHPEFRVTLRQDVPEGSTLTSRVSLEDRDKGSLIDPTQIKLNHKLHLEPGLKGPKGPESLQCHDCHHFSEDRRRVEPMAFDKDCRRCHNLSFDDRLTDIEAPHGDADVAYNFIFAEYAKLYLASEGERASQPSKDDFDLRRKPGYQSKSSGEQVSVFARDVIRAEARFSEEALFTKEACHLCHLVRELKDADIDARLSRFEIAPPNIPETWMPASRFDHGAHDEVQCDSCHQGVRESKNTSDLLLPGLKTCNRCHVAHASAGKVSSDCSMCHSFHDPLELPATDKHPIDELLARLNNGKKL